MFTAIIQSLTNNFAAATPTVDACKAHFFGLVPWYQYVPLNSDCSVSKSFTVLGSGSNSGLLLIGLAILDDLVRVAALVAVGFVIYGGIEFVTSQGTPEATNKARQTIINALIGLAIAILAANIVAFVGGKLGA